ncbi:hypothetical protein PS15p_202994 [Mucor circinelloides]
MLSCSSSSNIKVDMRRSNNHVAFGSINYYDSSHKKRDHDFDSPPAKRHNSESDVMTAADEPAAATTKSAAATTKSAAATNEPVIVMNEPTSVANEPATTTSESATDIDEPVIKSQDDIWALWKLHISHDSLHKFSLELWNL